MNCKAVQAVVNDIARDQIMDAGLREAALAHSASCSNCAIRLDDARSLTGGLRWLAAAAEIEEAPAHVEASLVSSFREHRSRTPRIAAGTRTVKPRWLYVAAGIAAVAIIVMLISLIVSRTQDSAPSVPQQAIKAPSGEGKEQAAPAPSGIEQRKVDSPSQKRRAATTRHPINPKPKVEPEQPPVEVEIATDFIPLVNRGSFAGLDSGQLVRVELPRSALMSFGLPMDMNRVNEPVKADVVMGQDGLARAIRFVR